MSLRLHDPAWLLLLAMAPPMAVAGWLTFRAMTATRRWVCIMLRVLLCAALAGALAGATLLRTIDRVAVIALIDRSGSVQRLFNPGADSAGQAGSIRARVGEFLDAASGDGGGGRGRRPDDLSAVIEYDSAPAVAAAPDTRPAGPFIPGPLAVAESLVHRASAEGTDTAAALRLARALAPPDAATRIVLFTDGNDTSGDAPSAAAALHRRAGAGSGAGIPIDVVPLVYSVDREVQVDSLEAPSVAPAGSTVQLRVMLEATAPTTGELRLARDGQAIDADPDSPGLSRRLTLAAGRTLVRIPYRLPVGRIHRFEAVFEPDDAAHSDRISENNLAQAITLSPGKGSVLIVTGGGDGSGAASQTTLARTLTAAGMEVDSVSPSAVTADPLWLQRYDLIMLQNVPAEALGDGVAKSIADYVTEQGGGLVMIGGPDSFGAGGWKGTPIEPILPVRLDLPEQLISPAAAVVIVIDCSGSMGFRVGGSWRSKQAIANDGAAIAVQSLDKGDLVGIIAFNNRAEVKVPLAPNRDPESTAAAIRGISADSGTNLPPALEAARGQLHGVKADSKHIIVLSDGVSQGLGRLPAIVERARAEGVHVSTIAVGDEADVGMMSRMASEGDGTFYRVVDPTLLPRIFLKAVRVVRSPQVRLTPFVPRVLATGSPLVEGLGDPPPLNGIVLTQPRADPTVIYSMAVPIMDTANPTGPGGGGEPLLAHWNAGIGRVAAFTSDASAWAAPWIDSSWPGYARLWTQIARTIARPQPDRGQELSLDLDGEDLVVRLNARDGDDDPVENLAVAGTLYGPGGKRTPIVLAQTSAGDYEAGLPAPDAGGYVVMLSPRRGGLSMPPVVGGIARSGGAEYRRLATNMQALKRLADAGGGRLLSLEHPEAVRLFDRAGVEPVVAREPMWRWLLMASMGLFLLDAASRRIAWDRLMGRNGSGGMHRRAAASSGRPALAVGPLRERLDQPGGPGPLTADDARAVMRAEGDRRKRAHAAAREAERTAGGEVPTTSSFGIKDQDGPPSELPQPGGLHEAKRRARERFKE